MGLSDVTFQTRQHAATNSGVSSSVDSHRLAVSPTLKREGRKALGQFMTPAPLAAFIAQQFPELPHEIRLLDAGAGMGALTAAFVEEACNRQSPPKSIDVVAYEVDPKMVDILRLTLEGCELLCSEIGVQFSYSLVEDDYILHSAEPLLASLPVFNCAILNPPYGKISSASKWRKALRQQGIETVNFYAAFVALAIQQLEENGHLVAITPRSFCNGSYYEPFRRLMLDATAIRGVHLFESRKSSFRDDDVLQENVIFRLEKGAKQSDVKLSTDQGVSLLVDFTEIIRPGDRHVFLRLPIAGDELASKFQALPSTLSDLGINASTGRVVDFRTRDNLRKYAADDTAPLIYSSHFYDGKIQWPLEDLKKYNALVVNEDTRSLLVEKGVYVLVKRISAKEEKRRIVAALYQGPAAGFDNKLNYFHENGKGLPFEFAKGLVAFLNSDVVDEYFRILSGHTQVNATDLRSLHYPSRGQLEELAQLRDMEAVNHTVLSLINLQP